MNKIVIFVKAPVPGQVKTRLCPPLSNREAAALYKALAKDALSAARSVPLTQVDVAYDPWPPHIEPVWMSDDRPDFFPQQGSDLGERLSHAAQHAFSSGASKVVIIGSDSPRLSADHLTHAFELLDRHDIVLGPAHDGGYYLIGLCRPVPEVFENIPWSTPRVFEETLSRLRFLNLEPGLLNKLGDIDTAEDLKRLLDFARHHNGGLIHTRPILEALGKGSLKLWGAPIALLLAVFLAAQAIFALTPLGRTLSIDSFSGATEPDGLPKNWKPLVFKKIPRRTAYSLVEENGDYFVMAQSSFSASAILKEVQASPKDYPMLRWRWKIERVLEKADARKKSGDDYAARIYVAFRYDPKNASAWQRAKYGVAKSLYGHYPPHAALNYIWDNKLPIGAAVDNPYTNRTKMIAVESGPENVGKWRTEERNIYDDYKRLFGEDPPDIAFIALMTDTDNTGETASAYFDDISLAAPDNAHEKQKEIP
ncbi:MAG: TIGR04282 family arsenosugar biosynthesis glycosyltransferase [Elusimicrobia bacterium]|nr:TIGR04282 family arsenosugar biosynthesis glycosyltransferase [Elusimicrobiota bacterium]